MRLLSRLSPPLALLIAVAGIGSFLVISWMWCQTAAFADTQLRPVGASATYVPPPGPIYLEPDSYYWLSYAQRIARGEDWRIRHTSMDNFPAGREVHWSQVISWSMVLFGELRSLFTHEPLAAAIEKAAVAINPLLFALAAAGLFAALAPRFGTLPSALFLACLGSLGDVGWTFQGLRPDHQGFHVVLGALSVVGLIFGGMSLTAAQPARRERWPLFQTPAPADPRRAVRWFCAAGVATGAGLWVSATVECFFVYPMMGVFAVLLLLIPPGRLAAEDLIVQPDLWRVWGVASGATGLVFYAIEYFPHHMAMRLEVNHPIYDVAMIACGEALRILSRLRWGAERATVPRLGALTFWLALAAVPVLAVARGPLAWHHMRDPQMLRFHNFIQEFYTFKNFIKTDRLRFFFTLYGILPLISLLTPFFLLRRHLSVQQVIWLWCPFAYTCCFLVLGYLQIRWLGFYAAFLCLNALAAAHFAFGLLPKAAGARRQAIAAVLTAGLLVQPGEFFRRQIADLRDDLRGITIPKELVTPMINKRMAYALKASPQRPEALIATPDLAPSLGYFAGIPCLTSFYWENLDGLHNAVRFFATQDPAEAHEIAVRTGATHVIVPPDGLLPNYFYYIAHGHYDLSDAKKTFLARLLEGKAPLWIQPDTVLNFVTTSTYSYHGTPVSNHLECFRIQD